MQTPRTHASAVGAVLVGVLLVSPDGTILTALRAGLGTILAVRGGCQVLGYLSIMQARGGQPFDRRSWALGRGGLVFASLCCLSNVCFVASLRSTTIAHTLLIAAAGPAMASGLSALARAEPAPARTVVVSIGLLVGVTLLVCASPGKTEVIGDIEAMGAAIGLSGALVTAPRDKRLTAAQTAGALGTCLVGLALAHPFAIGASDAGWSVIGFLVLVPVASSLVMGTRRHLAAAEVGLLMTTESIFGPACGWLALGQRPSWQTVGAGLIVLGCLGVHAATGRHIPDTWESRSALDPRNHTQIDRP